VIYLAGRMAEGFDITNWRWSVPLAIAAGFLVFAWREFVKWAKRQWPKTHPCEDDGGVHMKIGGVNQPDLGSDIVFSMQNGELNANAVDELTHWFPHLFVKQAPEGMEHVVPFEDEMRSSWSKRAIEVQICRVHQPPLASPGSWSHAPVFFSCPQKFMQPVRRPSFTFTVDVPSGPLGVVLGVDEESGLAVVAQVQPVSAK
jgi:hypothetical protein